MPRLPVPSVVLFVVDVPRVSAFYRELASMTLLHQDDAHVVLAPRQAAGDERPEAEVMEARARDVAHARRGVLGDHPRPGLGVLRPAVERGPGVIGVSAEAFDFDGLSRLVRTQAGSIVSAFAYDSLSRTTSETSDGRKTTYLRDDAGYTGVHLGCEHGVCGACTVMVDGAAVRSCLMLAVQADAAEVMTVEGLAAPDGTLHPVQQALFDEHALQCGFCTPGVVMTLAALTNDAAKPAGEQLLAALSGHVCRCTGITAPRRPSRPIDGPGCTSAMPWPPWSATSATSRWRQPCPRPSAWPRSGPRHFVPLEPPP